MNKLFRKIIKGLQPPKKMKFKKLGDNVEICEGNVFLSSENITIGNNVYLGFGGLYIGYGGIDIGSGTIIAHKVEIMTRNHNYNGIDLQAIPYDSKYILKPVTICENVWICSNVLILPGVTINEGSVVGMGSVVTKDVPAYSVVGGNPAKILKYRDKEIYNKLKTEDKIYLKIKNADHKEVGSGVNF